jgi:DNA-binding NarL/FixJ family response regulator
MLKTLIVEDNRLFRMQFGDFLRILWPDIIIDEDWDGSHAIEMVVKSMHDIVFMDISLPGTNGLKLTKEIKSIHPRLPVVIVTSHDHPEYIEAAKAVGANHFIPKDKLHDGKFKEIVNSLVATC